MDNHENNVDEKLENNKNISFSFFNEDSSSLKILKKKMKTLEELMEKYSTAEMSLDEMDLENSVYMREDYLVRKYLTLWKRYRYLIKKNDGRAKIFKKLNITRSKYEKINQSLKIHLANKKKFPDYSEIRKIVSETNNEFNLGLTPAFINFESFELFNEIGLQLQNERKVSLVQNMALLMKDKDFTKLNDDPADKDIELKNKLTQISNNQNNDLESIFRNFTEQDINENRANSLKIDEPNITALNSNTTTENSVSSSVSSSESEPSNESHNNLKIHDLFNI
ncbi:hypothetical protein HZS_4117 [Henneguya salminicola]|nr:hypothetical protein HZS_4117 [Henneguya salminicola]